MARHPLSATLRVKRLNEEASLPVKKTPGSAGFDVCACITEPPGRVGIYPGARAVIPLGIAVDLDEGWEVQVRPRSGLALKKGITVLNTPGTVDSDYRGEIKVILANLGDRTFIVEHGDRIAQLVVSAVPRVALIEVDEIQETERGDGGFGSTGVKNEETPA